MGPIDAKRSYQWGRDQGCEQVRMLYVGRLRNGTQDQS